MAFTYALNVISRRTVGTRKAFAGVSYGFAVTQGTAIDLLSSLGLADDLEFINSDEDITCVQVDAQKLLGASIDPGCVKTRTGPISTNYLYKFRPICRGILGVGRLTRHKVARMSDTSAFLHNQDPERTLVSDGGLEKRRGGLSPVSHTPALSALMDLS